GWSGLTLANGAILNNGDITGNTFNQTITIPLIDATPLANNLQFQDVEIQPGSLTSGQSATLSPIGTQTTANQRYVFDSATGLFTVAAGATLNITNGTALLAAESGYAAFGLAINGTMNVAGATFTHTSNYGSSDIQVGAGGHLTANNSNFG